MLGYKYEFVILYQHQHDLIHVILHFSTVRSRTLHSFTVSTSTHRTLPNSIALTASTDPKQRSGYLFENEPGSLSNIVAGAAIKSLTLATLVPFHLVFLGFWLSFGRFILDRSDSPVFDVSLSQAFVGFYSYDACFDEILLVLNLLLLF
jgi:hypothetical protein